MMNQSAFYLRFLFPLFLALLFFVSCTSEQNNTTEGETEVPSTSIHEATFLGDLPTVQAHIAAGTNLNQKDDYGSTPLHVAATFGKAEVASALIAAGADLNVLNTEGSTALHTAAFLCRTSIVEDLLKKGMDLSVQNIYGVTALQSVAGPFEEVKMAYDELAKNLGPFGLKLDYDYLEKTRPVVAEMIQNYE